MSAGEHKEIYEKLNAQEKEIHEAEKTQLKCRGEIEQHLAAMGTHNAVNAEKLKVLIDAQQNNTDAVGKLTEMHAETLTWQRENGQRIDDTLKMAKKAYTKAEDVETAAGPVVKAFEEEATEAKESKRDKKTLLIEIGALVIGSAILAYGRDIITYLFS